MYGTRLTYFACVACSWLKPIPKHCLFNRSNAGRGTRLFSRRRTCSAPFILVVCLFSIILFTVTHASFRPELAAKLNLITHQLCFAVNSIWRSDYSISYRGRASLSTYCLSCQDNQIHDLVNVCNSTVAVGELNDKRPAIRTMWDRWSWHPLAPYRAPVSRRLNIMKQVIGGLLEIKTNNFISWQLEGRACLMGTGSAWTGHRLHPVLINEA
jgi:hypothetical protein